jgi:hypothetical protein
METVSVALCTRDRERLLEGALEALCRMNPPERVRWEVLVILHNCRDGSRDVVERFRARLPLVCEVEMRPGLSHARNKAIEVASGDVMVWIDDDVRVEADWLRGYEAAFARWPQASVFGGPIVPEFEGVPPPWLQQSLHLWDSVFAARRVPEPDAPIQLESGYLPYGANFAVRMGAQRETRYDVRLGRQPGDVILTGEETDVIRRILLAGGSGRWVQSAAVRHLIPQERQTLAYLRDYCEGCAMSERTARPVGLLPLLRVGARVAMFELRFRLLKAFAPPDRWVPAMIQAASQRGHWMRHHRSIQADGA